MSGSGDSLILDCSCLMYMSAKRVYTELNLIRLENEKHPTERKFLIDRTPFGDDDSDAPTIVKDDHNEYYLIIGRLLPTSDIYKRTAFSIRMKIPVEYPFRPPEIEMITPIYHPNIGPDGKTSLRIYLINTLQSLSGKVCISMLRSTEAWISTNTLTDVIKAVIHYIDQPNIGEAFSKGNDIRVISQ